MFKRKPRPANTEGRVKRGYAKLGRAASKTVSPFLHLVLRERHVRVRTFIRNNDDGDILLVRSWFGHQKWNLPGGGIRRDETPAEAAVREVYEETGLRIAVDHLNELGTFANPDPKAKYTIACFQVDIPKRPPRIAHHRRLEMLDVGWFPLANLPKDRSPTVDMAVALLG